MYAVNRFAIISIEHKYLQRGHMQNEADCIHRNIEKELRSARKAGQIPLILFAVPSLVSFNSLESLATIIVSLLVLSLLPLLLIPRFFLFPDSPCLFFLPVLFLSRFFSLPTDSVFVYCWRRLVNFYVPNQYVTRIRRANERNCTDSCEWIEFHGFSDVCSRCRVQWNQIYMYYISKIKYK